MPISKPDPVLFLDDHRGVYIPRDFAECVLRERVVGVTQDQYTDLENPESETYWDTWADVLDNATVRGLNNVTYRLYQDGALWLIPDGMEWSEEDDWFVWPPIGAPVDLYARTE